MIYCYGDLILHSFAIEGSLKKAVSCLNSRIVRKMLMICFRKALRLAAPLLLMIGILTGLPMPVAAANMDIIAQEVVDDMTIGWNLGNALDCYESPEFGVDGMASEELWGNPPVEKALPDSVHEAGYDAVRFPVTWYNHMDPVTHQIDPEWMARVRTIVDYILADDMYCMTTKGL